MKKSLKIRKKINQLEFSSINHMLENSIQSLKINVIEEYEYVYKIVVLGSAGATIELVKQKKDQ